MKIYDFLSCHQGMRTFAKVPQPYLYLFEKLQGADGFWSKEIVQMLVARDFADWRKEGLAALPGLVPWVAGGGSPEEAGVYVEPWPFTVTTAVETFPIIVLTALKEQVDQLSAHDFLEQILCYELTRTWSPGVWIGPNVVAELLPRRDEDNPTKMIITYTDGVEAGSVDAFKPQEVQAH